MSWFPYAWIIPLPFFRQIVRITMLMANSQERQWIQPSLLIRRYAPA